MCQQVSFLCDSYLDECFPKKFHYFFFLIRNIALLLGYRNAIVAWNSEIYPTEGSPRPRSRGGEAVGLCGGALPGQACGGRRAVRGEDATADTIFFPSSYPHFENPGYHSLRFCND